MALIPTPHLLIVEDHPIFRRFLVSWLSRTYRTSSVGGGLEALRWLQSGHTCDALLLDLDMPRVSGWQVAQNLRASGLFADMPIVGLVEDADEGVRQRAVGLGVVDVFPRPFRPEAVLSALATAVAEPYRAAA